jgi:hypothetical protein
MEKLEKLTKKQEQLMVKVRNEWIDLSLSGKMDKEEVMAGVKWLYYASNLKEPEVVFIEGPDDFAKKLGLRDSVGDSVRDSVWDSVRASVGDSVRASVGDSVRASVWDSVRASVWDSVGDSVRASVWDSVRASVWDSVRASVWDSVRASVWDSVGDSVRASVWDSVGDSVRASVGDSVRASVWDSVRASVAYTSLAYDSDFGAWAEFYNLIDIAKSEKLTKYLGYLKGGAFFAMFFEKKAFVMCPPKSVEQDDRKRLHSEKNAALIFADGVELYYLHGVKFKKEWWEKVVNDKMTPEEIFAIDNLEHRRIAYQYMDKTKMKSLKDYKVLDEVKDDGHGYPMRLISFSVKQVEKPLKYLNCYCSSTGREYYLGTDADNCWSAKSDSFGLRAEDVEYANEW